MRLQRLQRYRANEILLNSLEQANIQTLAKILATAYNGGPLEDMSPEPVFGLLNTHTDTQTR